MAVTSSLTEMLVMCNAFDRAPYWFFAWLRERIVPGLWWLVPLAFVISRAGGTRDWFVRSLVAAWALVTLRLWDDLEDVEHDRERHPERILSRLKTLRPVTKVCLGGLILAIIFIAMVGDTPLAFVLVLPLIWCVVRIRQRSKEDLRLVWAHLILLKIPALVVALSRIDGAALGRGIGLYGFVGGYEVLHDAEARRSSWTPVMILLDMVCLSLGLVNEWRLQHPH